MGEVWAATHLVTKRPVAIKRLLVPIHEDDESDARARFLLEAQAASVIDHPNVIEVLDFVEHGDEPPLLVMELLRGETLSSKLSREHALSAGDTAQILLPVVSAVGTAHARGIIHRDLKPANIFLCNDGPEATPLVKVLDFGIAKWLAPQPDGSQLRTQTGSTLGTPCYMAPEQAIGERRLDHRVDVWSLGVILYECLSGVRPVEGENAAHMVMRLLNTGIIPLERLIPGLPPALSDLVGRMLSREPAQRPADLREVFEVLGAHAVASAPRFGEPTLDTGVPTVAEPLRRSKTPSVAWSPKTPAPGGGGGVVARSGELLPRLLRPWSLAGFGTIAIGTALALVLSFPKATPALRAPSAAPPASQSAMALAGAVPVAQPRASSSETAPMATLAPVSANDSAKTRAQPLSSGKPRMRGVTAVLPPASALAKAVERPTAAQPPVGTASFGLPEGASCRRSTECASRMCVAFACK